jgi:hypothetical protein
MPDQPNQTPVDVEQKYLRAKQNLEVAFKDFHRILNEKVLEANKTDAERNVEKDVVDKLYKAAVALDNINVGEGMMSLSIIVIREMLKVRDRVNNLEYKLLSKLRDVTKDLEHIKAELGIGNAKK